jgi:hypothetical protein
MHNAQCTMKMHNALLTMNDAGCDHDYVTSGTEGVAAKMSKTSGGVRTP